MSSRGAERGAERGEVQSPLETGRRRRARGPCLPVLFWGGSEEREEGFWSVRWSEWSAVSVVDWPFGASGG